MRGTLLGLKLSFQMFVCAILLPFIVGLLAEFFLQNCHMYLSSLLFKAAIHISRIHTLQCYFISENVIILTPLVFHIVVEIFMFLKIFH